MATPSAADRRNQARVCFRTPLTIITLDRNSKDVRPLLIEAWTEDVSLSGAQFVTKVPIDEEQVWMRFVMPGAAEQLIEARIVRKSKREAGHFRRFNDLLNVYGVKFFRIIEDRSVVDWLLSAIRGETDQAVPAPVRERFQAMQTAR